MKLDQHLNMFVYLHLAHRLSHPQAVEIAHYIIILQLRISI